MSIRTDKIATLLKHELALIFQRESRNLFSGAMITVTQVRISADLGYAKVYVSIFLPGNDNPSIKMVEEHAWHIKKQLAAVVGKQIRKIPELAYFIDDSLAYAAEIDKLLKS